MVLFDIVDHRHGNKIPHAHLAPQEETNLGTTNIVLDELLDDVDVVLPGLETGECLINISSTALNNE